MQSLSNRITLLAALIFSSVGINAQVKIGGTPGAPVSSAVLELDGQGIRGLRLPIVTSKEQLGDLPNPVNGLMVYAQHLGTLVYYHNGVWNELKEPPPGFILPYENDYNLPNSAVLRVSNAGNYGIGLHGISNNGPGVMGYSASGEGVRGHTDGGIGVQASSTGGWAFHARSQLSTSAIFTHSSFTGTAIATDTGRVGIGTLTPTALLDINTTKFGGLAMNVNGTNPTIQFRHEGDPKSVIRQNASDLWIGPVNTNLTGSIRFFTKGIRRTTIDEEGRMSIGTNLTADWGTLNVRSGESGGTIVLDGANPDLLLRRENATRASVGVTNTGLNIGTTGSQPMQLFTNGNNRMIISESGTATFTGNTFMQQRVAIGTTNTTAIFTVNATGKSGPPVSIIAESPGIVFTRGATEIASLSSTDNLLVLRNNTNAIDSRLHLATAGSFNHLVLHANGTSSMGTAQAATGYRLTIAGRLMAEEMRVQAQVNWPDYVFQNTYTLRPLTEVKEFVSKNKHLPGIPNAAEVEAAGFDVGGMQAKLLEKIEELTLYLIEANERIGKLEKLLGKEKGSE